MNIDEILTGDTRWLVIQFERPVKEFLGVADKIDLRQSDWSKFWKEVSKKMNKKKNKVSVNGKIILLNDDELKFVTQVLGDYTKVGDRIIFNNR